MTTDPAALRAQSLCDVCQRPKEMSGGCWREFCERSSIASDNEGEQCWKIGYERLLARARAEREELHDDQERHRATLLLLQGHDEAFAKVMDQRDAAERHAKAVETNFVRQVAKEIRRTDAAVDRAEEAEKALRACVEIVDKAGVLALSRGVELGATSWYVKACDAFDRARSLLAWGPGAPPPPYAEQQEDDVAATPRAAEATVHPGQEGESTRSPTSGAGCSARSAGSVEVRQIRPATSSSSAEQQETLSGAPAALPTLLGFDRSWSAAAVLEKLADAAEHLLGEHGCDAHGYELVHGCTARARAYAGAFRAAVAPGNAADRPPPALPSCTPMRCRVGLDFHHCESAGHLSNRFAAASAEKQEGHRSNCPFCKLTDRCSFCMGLGWLYELPAHTQATCPMCGGSGRFVQERDRRPPSSTENTSETPK